MGIINQLIEIQDVSGCFFRMFQQPSFDVESRDWKRDAVGAVQNDLETV
jgi:hypothetical protein